ncbi:retrovirus-related pol polyprotein from transposon TNT 1-94 [Tanacetum coccineum]
MTSSEQSNDVSQSETNIISDSNIIPYSQYLSETQQETVQNSNSSAQQDVLILSMFDQITTQVTHCNSVNKALTTELDRYKEEVKELKEKQNVENSFSAYWKETSVPHFKPSHSSTTVIVEVPKELPTVSMVNTSLKKLKRHLTGFDQVVKERTTATAITEGTWGFEHTKACFRDEIIPFIKELKDIFNNFNQYLVEELTPFKMNQVLGENERLLEQAIDKDIVQTVMNLSVNASGEIVPECQKCLELETELVKKKDFVDKETYDKLCKCFTNLEKHCITMEADSQLNQEIFQQENSVLNQNAPSFSQLFELSELKAQSQAKDTVIVKLKEQIIIIRKWGRIVHFKLDMDEIETLNIELEHRVTKLVTENEHLKQTYKQLYDSIKPKRVQSKEQCDALIKQVNIKSCPSINNCGPQKTEAIPRKKDKQVRFAETLTLTENTKPASTSNIVANKRVLHSTGVRHSTCASGSQPSGQYHRNDRITQPQVGSAVVQNLKKQDNSDSICVSSNDCMSSDNLCVSNAVNVVKSRAKSKKHTSKKDSWKPTGKVFTQVRYILETYRIGLHYSRKILSSKSSLVLGFRLLEAHDRKIALSSPFHAVNFLVQENSENGPSCKDNGVGELSDWKCFYFKGLLREGLGHNLFSVGQFCDSNLEVAFRQHTCFIRNLEGVDLLTGSRGDNLYTLSLGNMMASSPICLLSKASKTKSWLWHRRLSHLNFGSINHLARHGLVRGLPKLKFEKDHLSVYSMALGKVLRNPQNKSETPSGKKLYLFAYGSLWAMRVASVWKEVRLKETVRRIRTDNGTEFVNQTLREYYEKVGISHETSVARSPQQNGVVERRNRTLIEAARTMLIYAKAPLFLWAEAVATACYTQNRSMIRQFGQVTTKRMDIGIFIGYAPTKKAFRIYNRRTRRIIETIHVDFDELTAMASEHSSSGPALHEMTPVSLSSGLVPNPSPSTPFVPPTRSDWDLLFQPMFDESPNVDVHAPETSFHTTPNFMNKPSFLLFDAFLTSVEPKNNYKDALTMHVGLKLCKRDLHNLTRLEVWERSPPPDKAFVISLSGSFKPTGRICGSDKPNTCTSLRKLLYGLETSSTERVDTPMVEKSKLDEDKEGKAVDPSHYRGSAYRKALKCCKKDLSHLLNADHVVAKIQPSTSGSVQILVLWMTITKLTDYGFGFNKIPCTVDNKSAIALCLQHSFNIPDQAFRIRFISSRSMLENGSDRTSFVIRIINWRTSSQMILAEKELNFLAQVGNGSFTPGYSENKLAVGSYGNCGGYLFKYPVS